MNKHKLAILSVVLVCLVILGCPLSYASAANIDPTVNSPEINLHLNNTIGFVMQKNPQPIGLSTSIKGKNYTSDVYSGYFYVISTGQRISDHTFTVSFSYDGTMAPCYNTNTKIIVDPDYTGNLRPKAENEGRNNLTPTLVYGHVTFVLYNSNGTVNTEVTVNVYCNQKGTTWIERQG